MVAKGVSWSVGRVYFKDQEVYRFDLLPEPGHERPAFINLQQYHVEGLLVERALALPSLEIRWKNNVVGIEPGGDAVTLTIATPDGPYRVQAAHVVACDGSRSPLRGLLGLESKGRQFRDRFLIADVRLDGIELPCERRFWFDPPFHPGQSVLLHRQPDNVWRVDFQLGWDADPVEEKKPENIVPRVRALLAASPAKDVDFTLEWASVYTFACMRMERFAMARVLFAGDSAHGVSPFGARGANSGVQDAENLAWKLALVVQSAAPDALLDSYADEREFAPTRTSAAAPARPTSSRRRARSPLVPGRGSGPGPRACIRAPPRQQRPPVDRGDAAGDRPQHPDVDAFAGAAVPAPWPGDAPLISRAGPDLAAARTRAPISRCCGSARRRTGLIESCQTVGIAAVKACATPRGCDAAL
jgi:3-(3-hydroxy-phenyl)propionate hydroxylase